MFPSGRVRLYLMASLIAIFTALCVSMSTERSFSYQSVKNQSSPSLPLCSDSTPTLNQRARSVISCAQLCIPQDSCLGFNFLKDQGNCELFFYEPNTLTIRA